MEVVRSLAIRQFIQQARVKAENARRASSDARKRLASVMDYTYTAAEKAAKLRATFDARASRGT